MKILLIPFIFIYVLVLTSLCFAQTTRSIRIVEKVQNDNARFVVQVDVDKKDRVYKESDKLIVSVKSSDDGYLYLVHLNSNGKDTMLIPNKYQKENKISAGQIISYPASDAAFDFVIEGPDFGEETIIAVVSKEPLTLTDQDKMIRESATEMLESESDALWNKLEQAKNTNVRRRETTYASDSVTYNTCNKNINVTRPNKPKRYAVVVAVPKYKYFSERSQLPGCQNDGMLMAKLFVEEMGVAKDNCFILSGTNSTKAEIEKIFKQLLRPRVQRDDIVFIYWTGHGEKMSGTEGRQHDYFLVPYDFNPNDPRNTAIMETPFGQWVNLLKCKVLIILDTCFSAGMTNQKSLRENAQKQAELDFEFGSWFTDNAKALGQKDMAVICSSSKDQSSWFTEDRTISIMTKYFIEVVKNSNAKTHKDIVPQIKNKVQREANEVYRQTQIIKIQDELYPGLPLKP
ncbi:MAG: caspase family protein [Planctomycetaceae bacterium]|nr:caspase family protein [Planctomycetaceae bacterium]